MITPRRHTIRTTVLATLACAAIIPLGCSQQACTGFEAPAVDDGPLQRIADFGPYQVTGVAVSKTGRVFVNFPRWGGEHQFSVAEIMADGTLSAYPDLAWNRVGGAGGSFRPSDEGVSADGAGTNTGGPFSFVCVQSVYVDPKDRLWVLDTASPSFSGVTNEGGGAKLVEIDLTTNQAVRAITFDSNAAPHDAYLNDIRVDTTDEIAFVTDSGTGALLVVDLASGKTRRLLSDDPSTKANPSRAIVVAGAELRDRSSGATPQINSDGLALDTKGSTLYWQSLTNDRLYAIDTRLLKSRTAPAWQINNSVRDLGTTCVTDGMLSDGTGDLYFTALEMDAVVKLDAAAARRALREGQPRDFSRSLRSVARDPRLGWPDSLAIGPAGPIGPDGAAYPGGGKWLYITTSQVHRSPRFAGGGSGASASATEGGEGDVQDQAATGPGYALYRVRMP